MDCSHLTLNPPGHPCRWAPQVIVQARKPDFFSHSSALFKIVSDDGLLRPCHLAERGGLYCGGSARVVEKALGVEGDELLYVGGKRGR